MQNSSNLQAQLH